MRRACPSSRASPCAILPLAVVLGLGLAASATAAPPSPGTVLRQITPPPAPPSAPGPVLTLPPPPRQGEKATAKLAVRRIVIKGNSLIPSAALMPLVQGLEGKTITLGALNAAANRITRYYRSHGYPLAYAYVPAQTVTKGVVRITVVEPRYDRIEIEKGSRLDAGQARRTLGLETGSPIEKAPLERGLMLLNRTPGVRVGGTLVPGAQAGTSTLDVNLTDTPRLRAAATVDNYGSKYTGRVRGLADLALDDPFGYGGQIAFTGLITEGDLLRSGGADLLSPNLYDGLRASLYGLRTDYRLGGAFADLHQEGQVTQLGFGLSYPLLLQPGRLLEARIDLLRNRFRQSSKTVGLNDRSHVDLARLSLDGVIAERSGATTSGEISLSRGELSLDSADARAADAAGPNAAGAFWVAHFQLQRDQPLPRAFHLQASLSGQIASHNLDGSEKFYLGGPDGVMSYPVSEIGGDAGVLLRLKLGHAVPLGLPGRLDAALLGQYGEVWRNHSPYAGATRPNRVHAAGLGIGLDYHWWRLTAQLDYVHRLGSTPAGSAPDQGDQIWASLRVDF